MKLYTIGFTKKSAEEFFELLKRSGVERVIDTRLNNVSQLAGFTKKKDLQYFLSKVSEIDYVHIPMLAPTKEILDAYKKDGGDWQTYERKYNELITSRQIEKKLSKELVSGGCLLCSEEKPHHCHRRLVAEYLQQKWGDIAIQHL